MSAPHLNHLAQLIGNDSHAATFQSLGQYRSALLKEIAKVQQEQPAGVSVPEGCRQRLAAEGKPYPRSSCSVCGQLSPKWRECNALLAAAADKYLIGELTFEKVFKPAGLTNLSDLQAVFDSVEAALIAQHGKQP